MKMKIEQRWREKIELQDGRHFPKSIFFYGEIWYVFYGVEQTSNVISFYFIMLHQSTPGSLIREPIFFQKEHIQEQSQPLGSHQSHNQAASHRVKWIPSSPAKSLSIREQSYAIREWSYRIQANRFLQNAKQTQHAAALIRLLHPSPQSQYSQEQSQPLGWHQSNNQAASYREKWIPSSPVKSFRTREQSYPIREWSFRIQENRFLQNAKQKQHVAALIQLLHPSPKSQYSQEQSQPVGRHLSHNQAASHQEKWKSNSEKGRFFFPHYSHPPYRSVLTSKKVAEQVALGILGVLAWWEPGSASLHCSLVSWWLLHPPV